MRRWKHTKYNDIVVWNIPFISKAVVQGWTQEEIAEALGVGTSTFKLYLKEHPKIPRCTKRGPKTGIFIPPGEVLAEDYLFD